MWWFVLVLRLRVLKKVNVTRRFPMKADRLIMNVIVINKVGTTWEQVDSAELFMVYFSYRNFPSLAVKCSSV